MKKHNGAIQEFLAFGYSGTNSASDHSSSPLLHEVKSADDTRKQLHTMFVDNAKAPVSAPDQNAESFDSQAKRTLDTLPNLKRR